jgi:hypothetical protein
MYVSRRPIALTVQPVLQAPPTGEFDSLGLCCWQDGIEDGVEQVVRQRPASCLPAPQTPYSLVRPANLLLEGLEIEGLGSEKRRRGAARDVVAGECEEVEKGRETQADGRGAQSVPQTSAIVAGRVVAMGGGVVQLTVHQRSSHASAGAFGPPASSSLSWAPSLLRVSHRWVLV